MHGICTAHGKPAWHTAQAYAHAHVAHVHAAHAHAWQALLAETPVRTLRGMGGKLGEQVAAG